MSLDDELCCCFHVSRRKIIQFVRQTRPRRPSQISECFGAGTGCGWCIPFLLKIHAEAMRAAPGGGAEALGALEAGIPSGAEYQAQREAYRRRVAAGLQARNRYEGSAGAPAPLSPPDAGDQALGGASAPAAAPEAFDYTRYFSRSRPDPEPETLGGGV